MGGVSHQKPVSGPGAVGGVLRGVSPTLQIRCARQSSKPARYCAVHTRDAPAMHQIEDARENTTDGGDFVPIIMYA